MCEIQCVWWDVMGLLALVLVLLLQDYAQNDWAKFDWNLEGEWVLAKETRIHFWGGFNSIQLFIHYFMRISQR